MKAERQPAVRTVTSPASGAEYAPVGPVLPRRWQLERRLGWGGQAEVWLAKDAKLDRIVAIKIFMPRPGTDTLPRIRREVNTGRDLVHPNLVRVYELIEADGRLGVAMEWLPGGSLKGRLAAGPLSIDAILDAISDTLQALEFLHERNILHRDVKPANLMVGGDGRVRLGDLGLVKALDQPDLTEASACVGTTEYMSPEQLRNQTLTPATDLYSLGASIYELLTGQPPFAAGTDAAVIQGHLTGRPADPRRERPDCPAWLARFTLRLLEKSPRDRWPHAGAARQAFTRRGFLVSPRVVRRLAGWAATVLLLGLGAATVERVLGPQLQRPPATRVERSGSQLAGIDSQGGVRWSHDCESPVQQVVKADLDGDGKDETIAAAFPTSATRAGSRAQSEIVIVKNDGEILSRVRPERLLAGWPSGFRRLVDPFIKVMDVDRDGTPEVVALCTSRDSCHCGVLVYWPRWRLWDNLFLNSGYLDDVVAVPGASRPAVRFLGFNNNLGMVPVVGELALHPPPSRSPGAHESTVVRSPDVWSFGATPAAALGWYIPLPQLDHDGRAVGLRVSGPEATALSFAGRQLEFDRFDNPVPGPNAGRDLALERRWFFEHLDRLQGSGTPVGRDDILGVERDVRSRAAALLAEGSYRVILGEAVAEALFREGRTADAVATLKRTRQRDPYEDVSYRLALLEAFEGRLDAARSLLEEITAVPGTPAGDTRGRRMLRFVVVEQKDESTFRQMLAEVASRSAGPGDGRDDLVANLWARARLWWDATEAIDEHVRSLNAAPAGDAIACLARWRRGHTAPGDVAEMDAFVRDNPDMVLAGEVARSAAQLGLSRPAEAVTALAATAQFLDLHPPDLRDPEAFMQWQFGQLARALYAEALRQAGDGKAARLEAQRLAPLLRPGLLPRILVDGVMAATSR